MPSTCCGAAWSARPRFPGGLGGRGSNLEIHTAPGAQLVIYCVPGPDGRTDQGHRRVSYAWYDASRTDLLRETGCVQGDTVVASLRSDQLPAALVAELDRYAQRYWPAPWGRSISWAMTHGQVVGAPVAEYLPPRLVRGRVALAGDAAHVASPMTGAGFRNALLDVAALAACLDSAEPASVPAGRPLPARAAPARPAASVIGHVLGTLLPLIAVTVLPPDPGGGLAVRPAAGLAVNWRFGGDGRTAPRPRAGLDVNQKGSDHDRQHSGSHWTAVRSAALVHPGDGSP
jgi:FAD binding domain